MVPDLSSSSAISQQCDLRKVWSTSQDSVLMCETWVGILTHVGLLWEYHDMLSRRGLRTAPDTEQASNQCQLF